MRKVEEEQEKMLLYCGKEILLGWGVGVGICLFVLFLAAEGISHGLFHTELEYQFAVISCVVGSFCGGLWATGRCRSQRLLVGLVVGGGLFLLQFTAGLLFFETAAIENGGIGLLFGDLCGGAAAGFVAKGKKRRPGKKKKKGKH